MFCSNIISQRSEDSVMDTENTTHSTNSDDLQRHFDCGSFEDLHRS